MRLAVVCPSRERPLDCWAMVQSVLETSDADVLLYLDTDDVSPYDIPEHPRVRIIKGPRIGRGGAVNFLCHAYSSYDRYLLVSDDVLFVRPEWDKDIAAIKDPGLVHLQSENGMDHVNWPCISQAWLKALGWFNPPKLKWYCQDTALSALGDAFGRVHYIQPQVLHHKAHAHPDSKERAQEDLLEFLYYMATEFPKDVKKLRKIREADPAVAR
jgi:hypothetical protein